MIEPIPLGGCVVPHDIVTKATAIKPDTNTRHLIATPISRYIRSRTTCLQAGETAGDDGVHGVGATTPPGPGGGGGGRGVYEPI